MSDGRLEHIREISTFFSQQMLELRNLRTRVMDAVREDLRNSSTVIPFPAKPIGGTARVTANVASDTSVQR
jgi:hypothetical protein